MTATSAVTDTPNGSASMPRQTIYTCTACRLPIHAAAAALLAVEPCRCTGTRKIEAAAGGQAVRAALGLTLGALAVAALLAGRTAVVRPDVLDRALSRVRPAVDPAAAYARLAVRKCRPADPAA